MTEVRRYSRSPKLYASDDCGMVCVIDGDYVAYSDHEAVVRENERLREALAAMAKHFGPLEDNAMLNDECRRCFSLARSALSPSGASR